MASPSSIALNKRRGQESKRNLTKRVIYIKNSESHSVKDKRDLIGLNWHEVYPLLISREQVDHCVYDGTQLERVHKKVESSVLGGLEMGVSFLRYYLVASQNHEHFEQCPTCKVLYQMSPSPEEREAIINPS